MNAQTPVQLLRSSAEGLRDEAERLIEYRNDIYQRLGHATADIERYRQTALDLDAAADRLDES